MSGNAEVYEVQTLNSGRWTIQSRCRTEQQPIAEAHELYDRRQCIGVKVVKEAFDAAAKVYRESTVFRLPTTTSQAIARGRGGSAASSQGAHNKQNANQSHHQAGQTPLRALGDRLLAVMPTWVRRTPVFLGRYISFM
ncbi:MAG: hypothetical protein EXQ98_01470 [Alphaproteobacteria bacterium]|nr:hypothetical protein [Alphaproteobacteria bacterium]